MTGESLPKERTMSALRHGNDPFGVAMASLLLLLSAVVIPGCSLPGAGNAIQIQSLSDNPVLLSTNFQTACFTHDPKSDTSFWLSDVPVEALLEGRITEAQIMHIELLWFPRPGSTPIDSSATNASIRYIIITNGEVGVYIGAGFVLPHGKLSKAKLTVSIRDASLTLGDSTDGLIDLLSPARLSGRFTATNNPELVRQFQLATSQFVTDALGRTRFVSNQPGPSSLASVALAKVH